MKTCPNCNASVIDTAKFCNMCRFNIKAYEDKQKSLFCTECGAEIQPNGSFCTECGAEVGVTDSGFDFGAFNSIEEEAKKQLQDKQIEENFAHLKVGAEMTIGSYRHIFGKEKEPIQWIVLARERNNVLLISKYALENRKYNENRINMTWEYSQMRSWLNGEFINNAFNEEEKSKILTTPLQTPNSQYNTLGGNGTEDKIFLLSNEEANRYLTSYELSKGAYKYSERTCYYWLRSPGYNQFNATFVGSSGQVDDCGYIVNVDGIGVRPAMWIRLV